VIWKQWLSIWSIRHITDHRTKMLVVHKPALSTSIWRQINVSSFHTTAVTSGKAAKRRKVWTIYTYFHSEMTSNNWYFKELALEAIIIKHTALDFQSFVSLKIRVIS
jgi:hypothetical protein